MTPLAAYKRDFGTLRWPIQAETTTVIGMGKRAAPCPLLALSGRGAHTQQCPLLGVKRTLRFLNRMSAYDPKRTLPSLT